MSLNLWQRCTNLIFGGATAENRAALKIQMLLLGALSTLLYIGFPGTREWRRIAAESNLQTMVQGWDGLAWYVWLAAAPFMLMLIRRYPLSRNHIRPNLARIILGSIGLYLVVTHVRYLLRGTYSLWWKEDVPYLFDFDTYLYNTFALLPLDMLTYCGFFAVSFSVDYYFNHRLRQEEAVRLQLRTARLQSELTRVELAALRSQLHPHFLFNSFNALATLVRQRKNDQAVEIIAQLSALLRMAIDRTGLAEIPLEQELDFIRRYLEIERVRFGEKLRVEFRVDPEVLDAVVPNIVLQPLVENAIKHGISQRVAPGTVGLGASCQDGRLRIEISNDAAEEPAAGRARTGGSGIGLANTRAQLDKLYGDDYRLAFSRQSGGLIVVSLDLPLRRLPTANTI